MKSFKDRNGTNWEINGRFTLFEKIKTATGVDLLDLPTTQNSLSQLADPFTLGHVLYLFCAEQAEARGIGPEQFCDLLNGDAIHEAGTAILEEVIFFSRKDVRPALQMAMEKALAADRRMVTALQDRMGDLSKQLDAALMFTNSATSSPESSAFTQESGPSAASCGRRGRRKKSGGTAQARS